MIHADLLGERSRLTPGKTALVCVPQGTRFTYADLDGRARRLASMWIHVCGFAPGDRVGILSHNRVEFLDAFFAAAKCGVILVPLGTRQTAAEIEYVVRDAGLRGFVYDGAFAETVRALQASVQIERWIALDEPASISRVSPGSVIGRPSAEAGQGPSISHVRDERLVDLLPDAVSQLPRPKPEDTCCLLYTSGTTGKPKGVMVPHRMVSWNAYNTVVGWQLREDDVSPVFTPLYHAGGLGAFLTPMIAIGGTIILHAGFDVSEIWRTIEREHCTVVLGVPTIYKLMMEAPEFEQVDLSHIRWLISGGAPLPLYIIDAYQRRGIVFKQGYGLTEVGVNCFAMTVEESARKQGSIGKPLMFTEAKLAADDGSEVGDGEVGELWLRGPHVCKGYWNNAEATAAALDDEAWFHTGDLARRDEDGFFYIAGRKKDMLISGGVNIYPAEIEGELLLHPAVKDAAVVGIPDETWGEVGAAFVVLRGGQSASAEDLGAFLATKIAKYKIPRRWEFIDTLPRTPYGKVVKGELRDRLVL